MSRSTTLGTKDVFACVRGKSHANAKRSFVTPLPRHTAHNMSTPNSSLRHRGPQKEKAKANGKAADQVDDFLNTVIETSKEAATTQWEYKLALAIITILSFITRFWGINHPNEVVFDEVHFGKVRIPTSLMFGKLLIAFYSLHHTTYNEPTSSMSTRLSASFSSRSWVGSSDMMAISSLIILATLTSRTRSLMSPSEPCPPLWVR